MNDHHSFFCLRVCERERREALLKPMSPQNSQQSYNYTQFANYLAHEPLKKIIN